jgi:hypothetical protein
LWYRFISLSTCWLMLRQPETLLPPENRRPCFTNHIQFSPHVKRVYTDRALRDLVQR